jgi:hypothetical protein
MCAWPERLLQLEMKAELFPKSKDPLHCCTRNSAVGFWMKDQPEVVKIVTKTSRDMTGNDSVQSFRKKVEDVQSRAQAEHENNHIVKRAIPEHAHMVMVCNPNRDMAESILKV